MPALFTRMATGPSWLFDLLDHPADVGGDRHVGLDGHGPAARVLDLAADRFGLLGAGLVIHRHVGTDLRQGHGGGPADTAAGRRSPGRPCLRAIQRCDVMAFTSPRQAAPAAAAATPARCRGSCGS